MSERAVDVMPTISMSIEYGEHLNSFDVDIEGLVEYLRERGLNDMQIQNLHIEFSAEPGMLNEMPVYGMYEGGFKDKITMYTLEDVRLASRSAHASIDAKLLKKQNGTLTHELEHKIDAHSLKATVDDNMYDQKIWLFRKAKELYSFLGGAAAGFLAGEVTGVNEFLDNHNVYGMPPLQALGAAAVGACTFLAARRFGLHGDPYSEYWKRPCEIKARAATENNLQEFIKFAPKYVEYLTTEQIDLGLEKLQELRKAVEDSPEGTYNWRLY